MLIKLENNKPIGHPIVENNFKQLFTNISFPQYLTPESVEGTGFGMYEFSQVPAAEKYQKVIEVDPIKDEQGFWRQTWSIVDMNDEEKAVEDERKANEVRVQRDFLLMQCDWTQLDDAPITNAKKLEWATYRQALRDIPEQTGFPWDVNFPQKP